MKPRSKEPEETGLTVNWFDVYRSETMLEIEYKIKSLGKIAIESIQGKENKKIMVEPLWLDRLLLAIIIEENVRLIRKLENVK